MGDVEPDDLEQTLVEGLRVAERYALVEPIGVGAMGAVWSARHLTLGTFVAVKFLRATATSKSTRERFDREARLAARLSERSRHIVHAIDHGVLKNGTPFIVMELLQGESLSSLAKRKGRLPIPLVARVVTQLARALQVAHEMGIIHRDVKPANVFLCRSPADDETIVKLLDFGVAKVTLDASAETQGGSLVGTPDYMSPEQICATAIDARVDLWALAAIAYRLAVGRSPFGRGSLPELALRIVSTDPPVPSSVCPDLPRAFDAWVRTGLAKNRADRFDSARALAAAFAEVAGIADATGGHAAITRADLDEQPRIDLDANPPSVPTTETPAEPVEPRPPPPKRVQAIFFVSVAAALLLLGAGLGVVVQRRHARPSEDFPVSAAPPATTSTETKTPNVESTATTTTTSSAVVEPALSPPSASTSIAPSMFTAAPHAPLAALTAPPPKTTTSPAPAIAEPAPILAPIETAAPPLSSGKASWEQKDEP